MQDTALSTTPTPQTVISDLNTCQTNLPDTQPLTDLYNALDGPRQSLETSFPLTTTQNYLDWINTARCVCLPAVCDHGL
jgi:hypothetical protein